MNPETEQVVFTRFYDFDMGKTKHIELREPNAGDILGAVQASAAHKDDFELRDLMKERYLLVGLAGISPDDLDKLSACDYERMQIGLMILRADPASREHLRKINAVDAATPGEDESSAISPAMLEDNSTPVEPGELSRLPA